MTNRAIPRPLMSVLVIVGAATASSPSLAADEPPAGGPPAAASDRSSGPSETIRPRVRLPLAPDSTFDENTRATEPVGGPAGATVPGVSTRTGAAAPQLEAPAAYGSSKAPYTTARVAVQNLGTSSTADATPVTSYPYRATGRLWMRFADGWYVCTGSLISRNIVLTAAHCVHNYGKKSTGYAKEIWYYPAQYSSGTSQILPYGKYQASKWRVLSPYYNGTDTCTQIGVVCNNDLATVVLKKDASGRWPGQRTGYYSYGWNGYSYTAFFGRTVVHLSQLGYPVALDKGMDMERTDGAGWYYTSGSLKNTQLGSAQTGGSSGGPWLANLGRRPVVTDTSKASLGNKYTQAVVGVTSYGSTTVGYNRQGASYFGQNKEYPNSDYNGRGAGNIGKLVDLTITNDGGLAP